MKRKFAPIVLLFAVILSVAALAQSGTAAAAPPAAAPAATPAATPAALPAATMPGITKVGIINIQGAIVASNEGRRDLEALDKKFDPKRTELQNLNKEVEDLKKQIESQGPKMNEDARTTLVRNLETKQKSMQRESEDAQNEYQQQQTEIAQRILQKMAPVIDKFAKDNQFSMLIDVSQPWPQGQVLWFGSSADVTKAVVDLYNAQSGVPAPAAGSSSKPTSGTTIPKTTTPAHKPATTTPTPATPAKPQ